MSLNPGMFSSADDAHNTPKWLVKKIHGFLGGIELDPCTDRSNPCNAMRFFTEADDGLAQIWWARNAFANPPYGRGIGAWTRKLVTEYEQGNFQEAIALLPARTDTLWWAGVNAFPTCFIAGRLKFNDCGQSAPFPSALIYLGDHDSAFARDFGDIGAAYMPVHQYKRMAVQP